QSKTGGISLRDIEELITEIGYQCPWYPEKGSLDLGDWIKIGVHLHSEPRAPIQHLLLWQKCKEAVETLGFHSLKAPASLLPQEASAPPPYVQLTLPAPTSMLPETSRTPPKVSSKGSSAIQAGFKEAQEKGELTSEELTEGLNAFPVQEQRNMWYGVQNIRGMQFRQETTPGYIPDQLYGAGAFGNLQQATGIPAAACPAIGRCVLHAFKKVPVTGKPSKSFSTIKHGPNEPYAEFIDRLQEAIQRQIEN
ncbi:hypothetical protein E2320_008058, partial [Naja naja]